MNYKQLHTRWLDTLEVIYGFEEVSAMLDLALSRYSGKEAARFRIEPQLEPALIEKLARVEQRLAQQEPLQYILGQAHFCQLKLAVGPGVLIPRPETEELVAWILEDYPQQEAMVVDLCSGSGAIALALKAHRRDWAISGIEWSETAVALASDNAEALGLDVKFLHEDLFTVDQLDGPFDIMVSNPPYVRQAEREFMKPNVLDYEPEMALFVADDDPLVFYRRIAILALEHLKPKGTLYLEINEYLSKELSQQLSGLGYEVHLRRDLYLKDRMLKCQKR